MTNGNTGPGEISETTKTCSPGSYQQKQTRLRRKEVHQCKWYHHFQQFRTEINYYRGYKLRQQNHGDIILYRINQYKFT